jgi:hypothetical protein
MVFFLEEGLDIKKKDLSDECLIKFLGDLNFPRVVSKKKKEIQISQDIISSVGFERTSN